MKLRTTPHTPLAVSVTVEVRKQQLTLVPPDPFSTIREMEHVFNALGLDGLAIHEKGGEERLRETSALLYLEARGMHQALALGEAWDDPTWQLETDTSPMGNGICAMSAEDVLTVGRALLAEFGSPAFRRRFRTSDIQAMLQAAATAGAPDVSVVQESARVGESSAGDQ